MLRCGRGSCLNCPKFWGQFSQFRLDTGGSIFIMEKNSLRERANKFYSKENLIIILLIFISIFIRFLLANFDKLIQTHPDELLYYEIARSFFHGTGISVRNNIPTHFQKILYSIVLAPTFFVKNVFLRHSFIALLNAVLMSSSVMRSG